MAFGFIMENVCSTDVYHTEISTKIPTWNFHVLDVPRRLLTKQFFDCADTDNSFISPCMTNWSLIIT